VVTMGRNHAVLSTGNTEYTVIFPKTPEVTYGWRGSSIKTTYMYYEEDSNGVLRMWGVVAPFKADVKVSNGSINITGGDVYGNYSIDLPKLYSLLMR